jgi:hypothetical protein
VCMHQSRQAKVCVVQRGRGPWDSDFAPQLSVGKLLLSGPLVFTAAQTQLA